jgi:hypothetical protein
LPAPNGSEACSGVAVGEGGPQQGNRQLAVYGDHNAAAALSLPLGTVAQRKVEAKVFRAHPVDAEDVGTMWVLRFDAKPGSLVAPTAAPAFLKTVAPVPEPSSYALMFAGLGLVGLVARRRKARAGRPLAPTAPARTAARTARPSV